MRQIIMVIITLSIFALGYAVGWEVGREQTETVHKVATQP